MNEQTMARLGITKISKMKNRARDTDSTKIIVSKHKDSTFSLAFDVDVATLITEDIDKSYMNMGYAADLRRLYMWGDSEGYAVVRNKATAARCYVQTKALSAFLPDINYPVSCDVLFDALAKCYYIEFKGEE